MLMVHLLSYDWKIYYLNRWRLFGCGHIFVKFWFVLSTVNFSSIFVNPKDIPIFNGLNIKEWKDNVQITLGCMDIDLALRNKRPLLLCTLVLWMRKSFLRSGITQIAKSYDHKKRVFQKLLGFWHQMRLLLPRIPY